MGWRYLLQLCAAASIHYLSLLVTAILAALYGDKPSGLPAGSASPTCTPVDFGASVITLALPHSDGSHGGQPSLSLTYDEYEELLSDFKRVSGSGGLSDPELCAYLFKVTAGQVSAQSHAVPSCPCVALAASMPVHAQVVPLMPWSLSCICQGAHW